MEVLNTYADLTDIEIQFLENMRVIRQFDYADRVKFMEEMRRGRKSEKELKLIDSMTVYLNLTH